MNLNIIQLIFYSEAFKKKIADFETSSQRWGGGVQLKPNLKKKFN